MPWSDLVELVRQGELTPHDAVRPDGSDEWQPAGTVAELAAILEPMLRTPCDERRSEPEADGAQESDFQLSDAVPPRSPATLNRVVEAALADVRSPGDAGTERRESAAREQRWYCRVGGVAYGPIRFSQLLKIIGYRRLDVSPDDLVRHGVDGEWVRVDSVPALVQAAGLEDAAVEDEPPGHSPALADALYAVRAFLRQWSFGIPSIPAPAVPRSLRAVVRQFGRGLRFIGRYAFVIVPVTIWVTINIIAVVFPEEGQELAKRSLAVLASPVTWFALISLAAYSAAIWLNARRS